MRSSNIRTQYYVEGETERKLIKTLIEHNHIIPGQTDVLNPIQEQIKSSHLRKLPSKARIILVFDTDIEETAILAENLHFLSTQHSKMLITIPQVTNLEEEMIRCTNIRRIRDLLNCAHDSDFKTAFIEEKRLYDKLQSHLFDINRLWTSEPGLPFQRMGIKNQSSLIKIT